MDENHLSNPFKITLGGLFKKNVRLKMLQGIGRKDQENTQHLLLRILLPAPYLRMSNGTDLSELHSSRITRYFTYYKDVNKRYSDAESHYYDVKNNIIQTARNFGFTFTDSELILHIKQQLEVLFEHLSDQEKNDYKEDMVDLISLFDQNSLLAEYKDSFQKITFYDQLACMVIIAATWACWDKRIPNDARDLAYIILPSNRNEKISLTNENEWKDSYIESERGRASNLLTECRTAFTQKEYSKCGDFASQIIKINFADDTVLGEAYYHLAFCCAKHRYKYELDKNDLLLRSANYGNSDAFELLLNSKGEHAMFKLLSPIPEAHGMVRIVQNTENEYTDEFLLSIPVEMQDSVILKEMILIFSDKKQLQKSVDPLKDTRYLLFDKSQEKNFQDLLYILERIASSEEKTKDTFSSTMRWSQTTIYIRVSEESYSTLIDTALKRLGNFTVRVFIIDDNKWAAQHLLANYPLYNTIKGISYNTLVKGPVTINFTVICRDNNPLTSWLVREAYSICCFSYPGLKVKINLISPAAEEIKRELRLNYSEMFSELPDCEHVSSVSFLKEDYSITALTHHSVSQHFDAIESKDNSFNYYVVNIGDDIENLNYGIKLREWSIRNKIKDGKQPTRKNLPTIAFYCKNSDIAHLSQNLTVQTIDHGNRWYNNYNIKPFGMLRERYSWTSIDGGYWEKVSESTHLQYYGLKPTDSDEKKISALKDYFSRSYNRDSSMSVALSLPYRLFQVKHDGKDHIIPYASIDNTDVNGENEDVLNKIAEQFRATINDPLKKDQTYKDLLYYEHSRWLRWAYSRGWKKATPEQVITYMRAGNPKHQLYTARLHGCLCSVDELKDLSEAMINELDTRKDGGALHNKNWARYAAKRERITIDATDEERNYSSGYSYTPKDFIKIDKSNIEATADILETQWLNPQHNIESIEPEK